MESKIISGRRYESPFSVEELLNLVLPEKQSKDVDMDPCKASSFIGKREPSVMAVHSVFINLQETLPILREGTSPRKPSEDFVTISM